MGCGTGKKGNNQSNDMEGRYKVLELIQAQKNNNQNAQINTTQEEPQDPHANPSKCLTCTTSAPGKTHILDCTHALCLKCAKEQMEYQIKCGTGNISYYCKTCCAPKNLSIHIKHLIINLVEVFLSCGCLVSPIQLDKVICTAASPDKIVRFDATEKSNKNISNIIK